MSVAGAVLCGGSSRRMGRDKSLMEIDGVAMAERVARVLESAGCEPVRFVGGDAEALAAIGRDVLTDGFPGQGPVGGVITALRGSAAAVLVAACDLVYLDAGTVVAVIGPGTGSRPRVAHSGRLEPMLAWWPATALGPIERCFDGGIRALHEALETMGFVAVTVDAAALHNVNAASDVPGHDPTGRAEPIA